MGKMEQRTAGDVWQRPLKPAKISKTSSLGIVAHGRLVGNRETPRRTLMQNGEQAKNTTIITDDSPWQSGGFLKWGYPQNHPFLDGIFPSKASSYWGTPRAGKLTMDPLRCTRRPSRSSIRWSRWPFILWRTTATSSGAKRSAWRCGGNGDLDVSTYFCT